jgi:hypothetical protein
MTVTTELIDSLLADYKKSEDWTSPASTARLHFPLFH